MIWECEDCGWTCQPNPYLWLAEAECDNCGGELVAADNCEGQDAAYEESTEPGAFPVMGDPWAPGHGSEEA